MTLHRRRTAAAAILILLSAALLLALHRHEADIPSAAFERLEKIRSEKKAALVDYFENIRRAAEQVQHDEFMLECFRRLATSSGVNRELAYLLDRHFVERYGDFYDILFVDADGYVFHSIRKESDYHTNLFEGGLADTKLVRQLKTGGGKCFVEYEFYPPSGEPAAFFAAPAAANRGHAGWFVLQCAVNQVNTILTSRKDLGRSGEVYLVNRDRLMLSDSRFVEDSTILKLRVNTRAVREAMKGRAGRLLIDDYRGVRVFSAYEKFDLFGTSWIIIAEIDESEVLTAHYRAAPKRHRQKLLQRLKKAGGRPPRRPELFDDAGRVDMNEYAKVGGWGRLATYGVSSCTAAAILVPGKFAYLAHISPRDLIYRPGFLGGLFGYKEGSDFLGELIRRIRHYDVYPCQLRELQFVIVAPHHEGFFRAVEKILDIGVDLKNITFLYDPVSRGANVFVDAASGRVDAQWYPSPARWSSSAGTQDLEAAYKDVVGYRS